TGCRRPTPAAGASATHRCAAAAAGWRDAAAHPGWTGSGRSSHSWLLLSRDLHWRIFGLELAVFIEQPGIHHLLGHRSGNARAGLAIFDHHRDRDLRILHRREGNEQGMVPVALGQGLAFVALALPDRDHLRRAAFASDAVERRITDLARRTAPAMHHLLHAVDGVIPVARVLQLDFRQWLGVN